MQKRLCPVALYPLSSPNHNFEKNSTKERWVALYPLSSPNHNHLTNRLTLRVLRYILFHHQTTTLVLNRLCPPSCVISSFITKPQRLMQVVLIAAGCVISSFITKPQRVQAGCSCLSVALYPLSSPNHNMVSKNCFLILLRYILFHHQTTTRTSYNYPYQRLRYILFHHQTTTHRLMLCL